MPNKFIIEEFNYYKVLIFSHNTEENIKYSIELPLPDGRAVMRFVEGELLDNVVENRGNMNVYYIYYNEDQYAGMIDILRHEKPLFFYYNTDNHESYITTSSEPVGESE